MEIKNGEKFAIRFQIMIGRLVRMLHKPVYETRLRVLSELVAGVVSKGGSLLDVGCGSGQLGECLRDEFGS